MPVLPSMDDLIQTEQEIIDSFDPIKIGDPVWVVLDGKRVKRHVLAIRQVWINTYTDGELKTSKFGGYAYKLTDNNRRLVDADYDRSEFTRAL